MKITNASLGDVIADEKARSSIKLTYQQLTDIDDEDDEEKEDEPQDALPKTSVVLCSLTPGKVSATTQSQGHWSDSSVKIEQTTLDLILEEEELYEIENTGKKCAVFSYSCSFILIRFPLQRHSLVGQLYQYV